MAGKPWSDEEKAAIPRATVGAASIGDAHERFRAATGKNVTRAQFESALNRLGIRAADFPEGRYKKAAPEPAAPQDDGPPTWQGYRPRAGWEPPERIVAAKPAAVETTRVAVVPDTHVPHHDRLAWATTLGVLREFKPHAVVIIGDFISFASVSHHRKSKPDKSRIAAEYYAANLALDELEASIGNARVYYCEGNHERRPAKYVNDNEQFEGDDLFDVPVSLYIQRKPGAYHRDRSDLRERFTWLPLRQYQKRAWVSPWGVGYMHSAKAESRSAAGKHHAAYHAEVVAPRSGCWNIKFGHNHTFQMFRAATGAEAWCTGFLGNFDGDDPDPDFDYDPGPNPWAKGITLEEVSGPLVSTTQVPIVNGRAVLNGRAVASRMPEERKAA